ncbi:hypothetical protein SAMN05216522_101273 [Rosenbergiella nectarea]|uniref:Uncharacterized protein n=1 Tax=Rosenbergiella nectarea TaxID=988801 RepID=A0A1H9DGE1_9GAMM|nr:hypothetical protein [Rosenbergiella nectarea]SEQ12544.1 hypothetical protein SAMN05216522_101273 [Rosenbergiella nectarea]
MTTSIKMLAFSACLTIVSLAVSLSRSNLLWVSDINYSFLLQVALPHLGIAVSSVIGGFGGALLLNRARDKSLYEVALPLSFVALGLLIGGLFIINGPYVLMYTLVCPPLIGFGAIRLSELLPFIRKRGINLTLIVLLLLPNIALFCVGMTSTDWVMVIDFGTGFRVLFGALTGGLAVNIMQKPR